jgi:hypothetical protein
MVGHRKPAAPAFSLAVHIALLFPALVVRGDLGFHEAARGFAQHVVFFVE